MLLDLRKGFPEKSKSIMNLKSSLIIFISYILTTVASAQSNATGTTGGNTGYSGYINFTAAIGEDQQVSNNTTLTIGSSGNVDIYGAVQVDVGSTLQLLTGAVLNVYGNMIINGTLAIASGATLNYYGQYWINGSNAQITNNGVLTGTPGNAVNFITPQLTVPTSFTSNTPALTAYSGATQTQNIDGSNVAMDIVLHVQNNKNINLINSITSISGQLSFDVANGYVVTNGNQFLFTSTGTHTGASTDRYIQTNTSAGEVIKQGLSPGNSFTFPVGFNSPSDYTPAVVNPTTGAIDNYHVNVNNFATSLPNENLLAALPNVQRTWSVYSELNTSGTTSATLSFLHYVALEQNAYNHNLSSIFQTNNAGNWRSKGYACSSETTSTVGATTYYSQNMPSVELPTCANCSTTLNGTYFTKSACTSIILAMQLLSFEAETDGCNVKLRWTTAGAGNGHYVIEESVDGTHYVSVGEVKDDNASTSGNFSYNLYALSKGDYFFRLKMFDADGTYTYSNVKRVRTVCDDLPVKLYPNPVHDVVNMLLPSAYRNASVVVYNSNGQTVGLNSVVNNNIRKLNVSKLPAGMYVIKIFNSGNLIQTTKLIKY